MLKHTDAAIPDRGSDPMSCREARWLRAGGRLLAARRRRGFAAAPATWAPARHLLWALGVVGATTALLLSGCVREISSDERLERETRREDLRHGDALAEVATLKCDDAPAELSKVQDERRPEEERLASVGTLYASLRARTDKYDEALTRNTDLAYRSGNDEIIAAREVCVRSTADARMALESFIRDVMQMLVVDEVKGSRTTRVPRMSFGVLRRAIGQLAPDDSEMLLQRLADVERELGLKPPEAPPPRAEVAAPGDGAEDAGTSPAAGGADEDGRRPTRRRRPGTR